MAASSRQRYLQASTCARAARDLERIAAGHVHRLAVERPPPRPCPRVPLQVETDDRRSDICRPALAPEPPVTWNVLPLATFTGWPLNGPHHARVPEFPCRSKLTTAVGDPFETNDMVVSGTTTTAAGPAPVDWPVSSHPPLVAVV